MALFKSGNPALKATTFDKLAFTAEGSDVMTLEGTVNKIGILLSFLIGSSALSWYLFSQNPALATILLFGGAIGGFIIAIILVFNQKLAPTLAPLYVILKGLVVGTISAIYEGQYSGIVISAIILTFSILFCLLVIYKMRLIKVTENFKLMVASATMGVALFYLAALVLSFFNVSIPLIHSNGIIGIGFSLVVIAIAAANLVMDFDFIEKGAEQKVPKYMEWYAAFGLMVTLIWLYMEILRLLSKLRSR